MENYLGDLADIIRSSNGATSNSTTTTTTTITTTTNDQLTSWDFGSPDNTTTTTSNNQQSYELRDLYTFPGPLLPNIDTISSPRRLLDMSERDNNNHISRGVLSTTLNPNSNTSNVFSSRMARISSSGNESNNSNSNNISVKLPLHAASPNNDKTSFGFLTNEMIASCSGPKDSFIGGTTGFEIPSPRNSGIKRRKSQAKKVVCIPAPAPAAANSRQTGEVVPSDLWAWRKYGQKPIKGSPFPRGYYRCSSSKGCSARKQVERSRADPNMLVITYTSEHNHPWPTQRNALAGSSRSQPSKIMSSQPQTNDDIVSSPSIQEEVNVKKEMNKEVRHDEDAETGMIATPLADHNAGRSTTTTTSSSVKDETWEINAQRGNKPEDNINLVCDDDQLDNYYRPTTMSEDNCLPQSDQDFFKDFIEFEGDNPINLLFNHETKGSDPFSGFFYWSQNIATTANNDEDSDQNT